ncbi:MAG: flagellar biosynthesis protein FlhF [Lachnospiraceae bacterium]|nr:flagellar biosynthesis protein FlhF [Lachnospiraceae bacterium]
MIIKKFQAASENEAMLQVKEEMGSDAVIMNIKKTKHKGVMKIFKPTMVEVTAALEEQLPETANTSTESEGISLTIGENTVPVFEITKELPKDVFVDEPIAEEKQDTPKETAIEEKLNNLQSLLEKQMKQEEEAEEEEGEADEVMQFLQLIYSTLLDNEVNEKYANQIIDEMSGARKENTSVDILLSNIYQKMILKFGEIVPVSEAKNGTKLVFFVGPTGVGKTTTVAKIASKLKLEAKKNVALITTDTYRIAATEQLRTYAEILDVPFRVIYTPQELIETAEELKDTDLILVDTAGHSPTNQEQHADLKHFVDSVPDHVAKDVYLVLSATTKYRDLLKILDAYEKFDDIKAIFTKLDETTALGNILNVKMYGNLKLSYVTCGQNVPDDINVFDAQVIVRKLLGGH